MKTYRLFLALTFVTRLALAFSFATYVMFLLSRGTTLFEVSLINISFMVAIAIAEIPTGAFADLLGRKYSFLISNLVMAAGLLIYFFADRFWLFVLAEVTAGIGMTFKSGALEAWVVDAVAQSGDIISNDRIFSSEGIAKNAANIIGGLAGAYLGAIDLSYPWLAGAVALIITFLFSLKLMTEPPAITRPAVQSPFAAVSEIIKKSVSFGLKKRVVLLLMMTTLISSFFYQPLNMYWQPRFAGMVGGTVWILGWIWVLISLSLMLGSYVVKRLPGSFPRQKSLAISALLSSLPVIAAAALINFWPVLLLFCFYEAARGFMEPLRTAFINDEIPSSERATILSLNQVFLRLGAILGLLITGIIAQQTSVAIAWAIAAIIGLATIPIYLACRPTAKQIS